MVPSIGDNILLSLTFAVFVWNFRQAYADVAPVMLSFIDDVDGIALESMDNKLLTAPGLVHFPKVVSRRNKKQHFNLDTEKDFLVIL